MDDIVIYIPSVGSVHFPRSMNPVKIRDKVKQIQARGASGNLSSMIQNVATPGPFERVPTSEELRRQIESKTPAPSGYEKFWASPVRATFGQESLGRPLVPGTQEFTSLTGKESPAQPLADWLTQMSEEALPAAADLAITPPGPKWSSSLMNALKGKMPERATAEQVRAIAGPKYGVKQAEFEAAGMDRLLQEPKLTKGAILETVERNLPKLDETVLRTYPADAATGLTAKYSSYVEAGGQNYREVLVTAPLKQSEIPTRQMIDAAYEHATKIRQESGRGSNETLDAWNNWVELRRIAEDKARWFDGHPDYHDIANPVVRLRVNDRVTKDGKRILFIEEMQPPAKGELARAPDWVNKYWTDIGAKKAIMMAAEGGYDGVAWTTGQMQVERYPLESVTKGGLAKVYDVSITRKFHEYGKRYAGSKGVTLVETSAGVVPMIEITPQARISILREGLPWLAVTGGAGLAAQMSAHKDKENAY